MTREREQEQQEHEQLELFPVESVTGGGLYPWLQASGGRGGSDGWRSSVEDAA